MIELAIIPIAAICNRFRGGGVIDMDVPARKLISGAVLAATTGLLYNFTKLDSSYIQATSVAAIVLMGWYARNIIGTGYLFNAIHGWTDPKWKGVAYGTARGLLTLATTIPLAWVAGNMYLSLWGLLAGLQGAIYWLGGRLSKNHAVTAAEYLDGALYGGIICALLTTVSHD